MRAHGIVEHVHRIVDLNLLQELAQVSRRVGTKVEDEGPFDVLPERIGQFRHVDTSGHERTSETKPKTNRICMMDETQ